MPARGRSRRRRAWVDAVLPLGRAKTSKPANAARRAIALREPLAPDAASWIRLRNRSTSARGCGRSSPLPASSGVSQPNALRTTAREAPALRLANRRCATNARDETPFRCRGGTRDVVAACVWIALVTTPTAPYVDFIGAFAISGLGMALLFAPVANVVLSSVKPHEEGQASGANNAIRELGGVFGVAVLAARLSAIMGSSQSAAAGTAIWPSAAYG
jgi:hypothetical protein